jgi:hypothetical protein
VVAESEWHDCRLCVRHFVFDSQFEPSVFLAYFSKVKVGLSNHQPVCVCVPLITCEPIGGFS